jgi:hypothetical protein
VLAVAAQVVVPEIPPFPLHQSLLFPRASGSNHKTPGSSRSRSCSTLPLTLRLLFSQRLRWERWRASPTALITWAKPSVELASIPCFAQNHGRGHVHGSSHPNSTDLPNNNVLELNLQRRSWLSPAPSTACQSRNPVVERSSSQRRVLRANHQRRDQCRIREKRCPSIPDSLRIWPVDGRAGRVYKGPDHNRIASSYGIHPTRDDDQRPTSHSPGHHHRPNKATHSAHGHHPVRHRRPQ